MRFRTDPALAAGFCASGALGAKAGEAKAGRDLTIFGSGVHMQKLVLLLLTSLSALNMYAQSDAGFAANRLAECQRNSMAYIDSAGRGLAVPGVSVDVLSDFYACAKLGESTPSAEWPKGLSKPEFLAAVWKSIAVGEQGRIEHLEWAISRIHDFCEERPQRRTP